MTVELISVNILHENKAMWEELTSQKHYTKYKESVDMYTEFTLACLLERTKMLPEEACEVEVQIGDVYVLNLVATLYDDYKTYLKTKWEG